MIADDFATRFLERVAATYGLPYDMMAAQYDGQIGINYDKLARARNLIHDAIHKKHWGHRGWGRKIKRAVRLQREATGAGSNYWLTETLRQAEENQIRYRSAVANAVMSVWISPVVEQ